VNPAKKLLSVGLALAATGLISCSIPKPECTVGQSSTSGIGLTGIAAFSVRYKLVSGTGECANMKGEVVGFQSYHPASTTNDKTRDFSKTAIAIRAQSLGELSWMKTDAAGEPVEQFCYDGKDNDEDGVADDKDDDCHINAVGDFSTTEPDASDMCHVDTISVARVNFPGATLDVDGGVECDLANGDKDCTDNIMNVDKTTCVANDPMDPMAGAECFVSVTLPPADVTYEWSKVQVYVTAATVGTQFSADLKLTVNKDSCTYKAIGMWPAVDCGVRDPNTGAVTGTNEDFCNPEPDAPNGRPVGSGINPDFGPVVCDPGIAFVPVVDQWYTEVNTPDGIYNHGASLSSPRCALNADTIPALAGSKKTDK
jgi:hypothetical protein